MKTLLFLLSLFIVAGCASPDHRQETTGEIVSDSIIPESQMILILADAHTIEAALLIARNKGEDTGDIGEFCYAGLFSKYKISRERYQQNIEYYRSKPDLFIHMYEGVNKELATREKNFVTPLPD